MESTAIKASLSRLCDEMPDSRNKMQNGPLAFGKRAPIAWQLQAPYGAMSVPTLIAA